MSERSNLKGDILLCGESYGAPFLRKFTVDRTLDTGASVICYEAHYQGSGKGVLKEFYPSGIRSLERRIDGQLCAPQTGNDARRYQQALTEYLAPYEILQDAKRENQTLNVFIPHFEIYFGCDENAFKIGTAYVWTPEPKLETFEKICSGIHRYPATNPERKLLDVLIAMEQLTKCVQSLHEMGLVHRDIKPANFGFRRIKDTVLTQTLSLFDVNTVCFQGQAVSNAIGSAGYMEPESGYQPPGVQTDIYAIGATLFHALLVTDETRKNRFLYRTENYPKLKEMVDTSEIIRACEGSERVKLRDILTRILRKCLSERTYRYSACEELLQDLHAAILTAEKLPNQNRRKNSRLSLCYHLYSHPLYGRVSNDENMLSVLLFGLGDYGRDFLDLCLQNGQSSGKVLSVTIVSRNRSDWRSYLMERPELSDFFDISESDSSQEYSVTNRDNYDSYGSLRFIERILPENKGESEFFKEVKRSAPCEPQYVFISLGEDGRNLNAAKQYGITADGKAQICFVWEGNEPPEALPVATLPVFVNQKARQNPLHNEMERMAFNTHLIWKKDLNVDYNSLRSEFRKPYFHDACVSNVLSIKYKLYGIGIDLDSCSAMEAAKQFYAAIRAKDNRDLRNRMICAEHRRWVTEKLCAGWTRIRDLERCAGGMTRDEREKQHVCLVRSRNAHLLTRYPLWKWDTASDEELAELDELERVSVALHRIFLKHAEKVREHNLLGGGAIREIRALIQGNRHATICFEEWFACLTDIWNGTRERVHVYRGLKEAFLDALRELSDAYQQSVMEQVKAFETLFYPVLASMEYRDYKKDDVALIDNIPFILTYSDSIRLAIPFLSGEREEIFGNVSTVTVINPSRLIYLCRLDGISTDSRQQEESLLKSVSYALSYFDKKRIRSSIEMAIACRGLPDNRIASIEATLKAMGGRIGRVTWLPFSEDYMLSDVFADFLSRRRSGFLAVEQNQSNLSGILLGGGVYAKFPHYQFDISTLMFHSVNECEFLRYVRKKPYLRISDVAAFRQSYGESVQQPEFFEDYKTLWKAYAKSDAASAAWKFLCSVLSEYAKTHDVIAEFDRKCLPSRPFPLKQRYIMPSVCLPSVSKIIKFLKDEKIAGAESYVRNRTTDSCEIVIQSVQGFHFQFDRLFSNPYILTDASAVNAYLNPKNHAAYVTFDNLFVRNADFKKVPQKLSGEIEALLTFFREMNYLSHYRADNDGVSFTYASRQIKRLLTQAGRILEVYTYHKIKEFGSFDDVAGGYEIVWDSPEKHYPEVKNEFDCILTKGFRVLFVECKATNQIQEDFYFKLANLSRQFGLRAKAVLVADTREKEWHDIAPLNSSQRERGNTLDVLTIWKQSEINDIGKYLLQALNGSYMGDNS